MAAAAPARAEKAASTKRTPKRPVVSPAVQAFAERAPMAQQPLLEERAACPCGGGCPRCGDGESGSGYPPINNDRHLEREASAAARQYRPSKRTRTPLGRSGTRYLVRSTPAPDRSLGPGRPLDVSLRAGLETFFAADFCSVRLHTGPPADLLAQRYGARAFAFGSHIVLSSSAPALQSDAGSELLAHELTHCIQQAGAQRDPHEAPASSGSQTGFRRDGFASLLTVGRGLAVQRFNVSLPSLGDVAGAVTSAGVGAWERATEVGGAVAGFAADSLAGVVDYLAPGLLRFLRGGYMGQITDLFCSGLDALAGALLRPLASIDFMTAIETTFSGLTSAVQGMWAGLGRGASAALGRVLKPLVNVLDEYGGPLVQGISGFADLIDGILSSVWENIGVPALDFLGNAGGAIWRAFTGITDWLERITRPIRNASAEAWNWLMRQFGLAWDNSAGIRQWVADKASELWKTFLKTIEPIKAPLMAVGGALVLLSPLGPIIILSQVIPPLWEKLVWLWNNWNTDEILVEARDILANDILPAVLGLVTGVSSAIAGAAAWLATTVSSVAQRIAGVVGAFGANACLRAVTRLVDHIADQFHRLDAWAKGGFTGLGDAVRSVFNALAAIFRPILDFLLRLILVAVNPPMLPLAITAGIWLLCPDELKPPVINFILGLVTAFLRASSVFLVSLSPLAQLMKSAALGFLAEVRGREDPEKVAAANKVANIAAGGGPQFVAGYTVGLLRGIIEGILDPFRLIGMLIQLVGAICTAIGDRLIPLLYAVNPDLERSVTALREAVAVPPAPSAAPAPAAEGEPPATGPPAAAGETATPMPIPESMPQSESIPAVAGPGPPDGRQAPAVTPPNPAPDQVPPSVEERFGEPRPRTAVARRPGRGTAPARGPPELGHHGDGGSPVAIPDAQTATSIGGAPETISVPEPAGSGIGAVPSPDTSAVELPDIEGSAQAAVSGQPGELRAAVGATPDAALIDQIDPAALLDVAAAGAELSGADEEIVTSGGDDARAQGSSVGGIAGLLGGAWDQVIGGARNLGGRMASGLLSFLALPDYSLGNKIGFIAGIVLFEVLLTVFTGGGWAAASAVAKALRPIIRFLNMGGEILGLLGRALRPLRGPLASAFGAARGFMSRFPSVARFLDKLENAARALFRTGDNAAAASSRGTREVAEQSAETARRRAGSRTGREGLEEAGTQAGRRADQTAKAAELPAAIAAVQAICRVNDARDTPIPLLLPQLYPLRSRFRWIKRFEARGRAPAGRYDIIVVASENNAYRNYSVAANPADIQRAARSADSPPGSLGETVVLDRPLRPPPPPPRGPPMRRSSRPPATYTSTERTTRRLPVSDPEVIRVQRPLRRREPLAPRSADEAAIAEARAARDLAMRQHAELPARAQQKTTAVGTATTAETRSGWGRQPKVVEAVEERARLVGHELKPHAHDPTGRPGRYHASHAEKQQMGLNPSQHSGVSRAMCDDCIRYFQAEASHQRRNIVVSDPQSTRVFEPNGRFTEYWDDGAVVLFRADGSVVAAPALRRFATGPMPARIPPGIRHAVTESGHPLAREVRSELELFFRFDLSDVRVHTGAAAASAARAVNARAFTLGSRIVFGSGQYAPDTRTGRELLVHELTHVGQAGPEGVASDGEESSAEREAHATARRFAGHAADSVLGAQAKFARTQRDHPLEQEADAVAKAAETDELPHPPIRPAGILGAGNESVRTADLPDGLLHPNDPGAPLEPQVRRRIEPLLGADLSSVRVHSGPAAHAAAEKLHAKAFAHRDHIWLNRGESSHDVALIAHEAAHVVQQRSMDDPPIQRWGHRVSENEQNRIDFQRAVDAYNRGRYAQARAAFAELYQRRSLWDVRAEALYNLAMCNLRLRHYEQAITQFEDYLAMEGTDRHAGAARLAQARRRGDGDAGAASGESDYREARERFLEGQEFFERGHFLRALQTFTRLRSRPGLPSEVRRDLLYNIGQCHLQLRRYAEAERAFQLYLQMSGSDQAAGLRLLTEARNALEAPARAGREAQVETARANYERAVAAFAQRRWAAALTEFLRVIALPAIDGNARRDIRWNIGLCRLRLRRFAAAATDFRLYLEMPGADRGAAEAMLDRARRGVTDLEDPRQRAPEPEEDDVYIEGRMSPVRVTAITREGSRYRAVFGQALSEAQAREYIWPGAATDMRALVPVHGNPLDGEGRFSVYHIDPAGGPWEMMRPSVRRMVWAQMPTLEQSLPGSIPTETRAEIFRRTSEEEGRAATGSWHSADGRVTLWWARRSGNRTAVQLFALAGEDRGWYLRTYGEDRGRRIYDAYMMFNRDMRHLVLEQGVSISEARQYLHAQYREMLFQLVQAYVAAFAAFASVQSALSGTRTPPSTFEVPVPTRPPPSIGAPAPRTGRTIPGHPPPPPPGGPGPRTGRTIPGHPPPPPGGPGPRTGRTLAGHPPPPAVEPSVPTRQTLPGHPPPPPGGPGPRTGRTLEGAASAPMPAGPSPRTGRTLPGVRAHETPAAPRAAVPEGAGPPAGGRVVPMGARQRMDVLRGHPDLNTHNYDGTTADGREMYRAEWAAVGGQGRPPPNGFITYDAQGRPREVIGYWPHGIGRTQPRSRTPTRRGSPPPPPVPHPRTGRTLPGRPSPASPATTPDPSGAAAPSAGRLPRTQPPDPRRAPSAGPPLTRGAEAPQAPGTEIPEGDPQVRATSVAPLTQVRRDALVRKRPIGVALTRTAGDFPEGRERYRGYWEAFGGHSAPPAFGFTVHGPEGTLLHIFAHYPAERS